MRSTGRLDVAAWFFALASMVLLPHLGCLDNFFTGDDYIWLKHARMTLIEPLHMFEPWIYGYLRPMSQILFVGLERLFGLHYLPYQVTLLVLHVVNSYLLGLLTLRLGLGGRAVAVSASLLFAVWYAKSSTVMWASSLGDILGHFWILVGLLALAPREGRPKTSSPLFLALSFLLAGFSKETAVVGFGIGILKIVLFQPRRDWTACLPLVATLILFGVAYSALSQPKVGRILPGPYFGTAWILFSAYALVPISAETARLFPAGIRPAMLLGASIASLAIVGGGLFVLIRGSSRLRFLVGWIALGVLLVAAYHSRDPISFMGREIGGQRYVYTSSAAACIAVAWFIATLGKRASRALLVGLLVGNATLVVLHEHFAIEPRVQDSRGAWARALKGDRSVAGSYFPDAPEVSASMMMLAQDRDR